MQTWTFVLRRVLSLIPVLFGVLLIVFVMGRVIPSNPLHFFIGQEADAAFVERMRQELRLDDPLWVQFGTYVVNLARGDLGMSWSTRNPVAVDLATRLPATFELVILSMVVVVALAIPLGVLSAIKVNTWIDHVARIVSLIGVAIPSFWLGLLLIYWGFFLAGIFPPPLGRTSISVNVQSITGFYLIDTLWQGDGRAFRDVLSYLLLPVIALSIERLAQLSRLVRATMLEVLNDSYIEAARSQGLRTATIHYKLALKNALLAPITQIALIFGNLLGGAVIIEIVFSWPGAGSWAVDAALAGDFAPVQAFALISAFARVAIFLLTDIVYVVVDPRIRFT